MKKCGEGTPVFSRCGKTNAHQHRAFDEKGGKNQTLSSIDE